MQLLTSWRDSLLLCIPSNAKLFGLATVHAFFYTYRIIGRYFLLFLISLIVAVISTATRWFVMPVIVLLVYMFCVYLVARPSTLRKDCNYFIGYGTYFIWFSLFFIAWLTMICIISQMGVSCWNSQLPLYAPLFPFFSITVAFLCDTDGGFIAALLSIYRGFLFFMYNLPICGIFSIFFIGLAHLLSIVLTSNGGVIAIILLWPFVICSYVNLYIKRVHEQFFLYFGKQD